MFVLVHKAKTFQSIIHSIYVSAPILKLYPVLMNIDYFWCAALKIGYSINHLIVSGASQQPGRIVSMLPHIYVIVPLLCIFVKQFLATILF